MTQTERITKMLDWQDASESAITIFHSALDFGMTREQAERVAEESGDTLTSDGGDL